MPANVPPLKSQTTSLKPMLNCLCCFSDHLLVRQSVPKLLSFSPSIPTASSSSSPHFIVCSPLVSAPISLHFNPHSPAGILFNSGLLSLQPVYTVVLPPLSARLCLENGDLLPRVRLCLLADMSVIFFFFPAVCSRFVTARTLTSGKKRS